MMTKEDATGHVRANIVSLKLWIWTAMFLIWGLTYIFMGKPIISTEWFLGLTLFIVGAREVSKKLNGNP